MKRLLSSIVAALLLAACASPGRGPADIAVYDLGPPASPTNPLLAGAASAHAGISVEVRLPVWLDGQAMLYRLTYADSQRLHQYAKARWSSQPGPLLQQRMRQLLETSPGATPCTLRIELDSFLQVFDSPDSSRGELRGSVLLLGRNRSVIARQLMVADRPAPTADAAGGVRALSDAATGLAESVAAWLQRQDLSSCRVRS